jgi:hypothetical protein
MPITTRPLPGAPRISREKVWSLQQAIDLKSMWDDLQEAVGTPAPVKFADLPAASLVNLGVLVTISDSTTTTWGAVIAGGGANTVLAWSNGAHWTVVGK